MWKARPLWTVAREVRTSIDPTSLGEEVYHYSIPVLEATGAGRVEPSAEIQSAKQHLLGNEVLISKLNPRKSRVVAVEPQQAPIVASTEFIALVPDGIDRRFLVYLLLSESTRQYLNSHVQSVTRSHQRVAPETLTRLPVRLPYPDEQRRIADFLDAETARIDRVIGLQRSLSGRLFERDRALRDGLVDQMAADFGEIPLRRLTTHIEQGT